VGTSSSKSCVRTFFLSTPTTFDDTESKSRIEDVRSLVLVEKPLELWEIDLRVWATLSWKAETLVWKVDVTPERHSS
jgi:hypothetical protein